MLNTVREQLGADMTIAPEDEAALVAGLADTGARVDSALHEEAVDRVIALYRRCLADRDTIDGAFLPGGEWAASIAERPMLYQAMLADDRALVAALLRDFWRNDLGLIVKEYATFAQLCERQQPRTTRFIENVRRNFSIWRRLVQCAPEMLDVPAVGAPWGLSIGGRLVVPKATRFHALAWQIGELCRSAPQPLVAEIGAGYGGAAYYLLRDRPDVRWVDFDLPETLVLAAYYLLCALPQRRIVLYGEPGWESFTAQATLLPNHLMTAVPARWADVLVNTFSFSEMPMPTLRVVLDEVTRFTRRYMLHHNMDRPGVVNRGFERTPASQFPIGPDAWLRLHAGWDDFHGSDGDYRAFLYLRRDT